MSTIDLRCPCGRRHVLDAGGGDGGRMVSQRTCGDLGLNRRDFLDLVRRFRASGGKVRECGKLRLVSRAALLAFLDAQTAATVATRPAASVPPDGSALADELGFELEAS